MAGNSLRKKSKSKKPGGGKRSKAIATGGRKIKLTPTQQVALLQTLQARFSQNQRRHPALSWTKVEARLKSHPDQLWSLHEMERTGGEPDVVGHDPQSGAYIFIDCCGESPAGRRSVCFDREGLESRKEHRPETSAVEMAEAMGIELLSADEYRQLQLLGEFDAKTSSWLQTPAEIRKLGGALFGDRRYGQVFVYHNGAQSYYAARGFRGSLRV